MSENSRSQFSKIGILCNPMAGRVKNKATEIESQSQSISAAVYREARIPTEFEKVLKEFAALEIDLLVIIAGDGTIHAVLSQIFNGQLFASVPVLSFIPAGTTNMTALDNRMKGKPETVLARLIQQLKDEHHANTTMRPLVRVQNGASTGQYGFFFGTGIIADAVAYFQDNIKKTGLTGERASAIVFIRYLMILIFKRRQPKQSKISIYSDGLEFKQGSCLVLLISSLDRLLFGMKPYWGTEDAALHMTLVNDPPRRLWRSLLKLLTGGGHKLLETDGYTSHNISKVCIQMSGKYVIDGEIYSVSTDTNEIQINSDISVSILSVEESVCA